VLGVSGVAVAGRSLQSAVNSKRTKNHEPVFSRAELYSAGERPASVFIDLAGSAGNWQWQYAP